MCMLDGWLQVEVGPSSFILTVLFKNQFSLLIFDGELQ